MIWCSSPEDIVGLGEKMGSFFHKETDQVPLGKEEVHIWRNQILSLELKL